MFDWVIPPQTAVSLYIYMAGRSCPTRNPFASRNSLGFLNSTRTRGPSVRPVRPACETGVAVAGSATGRPTSQTIQGHWSDRWRQHDRLCANFGCELLTQNPHPAPSTQQAEQAGLTHEQIPKCASQFS
jgi:hypothetical protein